MLRVLDNEYPDHGLTREQIRAFLHEGFPWHTPEIPHPELSSPKAWWAYLEAFLAGVYRKLGYNEEESGKLAQQAHKLILEPEGYTLYEDTIPALRQLAEQGWRHIVLSNNFPEMPRILYDLPVSDLIYGCICSGITGYEKPHPQAYSIALESAGYPEKVWMVGDNITADVRGAEAAGIPAILVRSKTDEKVKYYAENLLEAASIIQDTHRS
jgi:putative hydrolase of the HAD superfamily